jgi:hypothetical protein
VALKRSDRAPHPVRGEWSCKRKTSRRAWILASKKESPQQLANVLWLNFPSGRCSTNLGNHFFSLLFMKCKYLQMKMKGHILLVLEDAEESERAVAHVGIQVVLSNGYLSQARSCWTRVHLRLSDCLYF